MKKHPAIEIVTERITTDVIGGAADTAKEVMFAMGQVVSDSKANELEGLFKEMDQASLAILKICPSLAPPINALHMMMGTIEKDIQANNSIEKAKENLLKTQNDFIFSLDSAMGKIALIGAELIKEGDRVFMFSMSSTIWNVLRKAKEQGKNFTVLVTEASPTNEGLWTVDEMNKVDIPVEVSVDACIAEMISGSDIVFGGVDAVSSTGSSLNKTGTYLCALVAYEYGVPFYFVTDSLKFDTSTLLGLDFKSETISYQEVLGEKKYGSGVSVVGRIFDVTPPKLITGYITELGIIPPSACINVMWNMRLSNRINELMPAWAHDEL